MKILGLIAGATIVALGAAAYYFAEVSDGCESLDPLRDWYARNIVGRSNCGGNGAVHLQTLVVAQVDFRSNDRDANGVPDFWRGDVAGLYGLRPKGGGEMLHLIEISTAGADDRPVTDPTAYTNRAPKGGYWFRAIRHADEREPSPDRYAFVAFPARYGYRLRWTYVVDERQAIYRKKIRQPGLIEVMPADPVAEGWTPLPF